MMTVPEVAAAVVAVLAPYLAAGATEGAKKLGGTAAERLTALYDKVRARLTSPLGEVALAEIEKSPERGGAQEVLRLALEQELANSPVFHAELAGSVEEIRSDLAAAPSLASSIMGTGNVNVQVAGSGNRIEGVGKLS
jgi:hypothetical protein